MNIGSLFARHAKYRPDQLAVVCEGQELTYHQYNAQINRLANALAGLGIDNGDTVAMPVPEPAPQRSPGTRLWRTDR